jgi:hypothetical protein
MKTQKKPFKSILMLIILSLSVAGFTGCNNSDDPIEPEINCMNWSDQFLEKATIYSNAAILYSISPTLANCQNYKKAGLDYIDAMESVIDCVPESDIQDYKETLDEYRAEVNAISCE